jgi:hypothetical protein
MTAKRAGLYSPRAKVGGPQISPVNHKSSNLQTIFFFRFADLQQMWQFANHVFFVFADHVYFAICGIAIEDPIIFLQTYNFRNYIIFLLTNISFKCSLKFKNDFWLLG